MREINDNVLEIMDLGCGKGEIGYLIRVNKNPNNILIGVDIFKPYIDMLSKLNIYNKLFVKDITKDLNFKDYNVDIILLMEIIEHLNKKDFHILIQKLKDITRKKIIITTPYGEYKSDSPVDNNVNQIHLSYYLPDELRELGFKVKIIYRLPRLVYLFERIYRKVTSKNKLVNKWVLAVYEK